MRPAHFGGQLKGFRCGSVLVSPLLLRHSLSWRQGRPTRPRRFPASLLEMHRAEPVRPGPRDRAGRARQLVRSVGDPVSKSSSKPAEAEEASVPSRPSPSSSRAADVMRLSLQPGLLSITEDAPMASAGYSNPQRWPPPPGSQSSGPTSKRPVPEPPAIAVVDTGRRRDRADFGGRVVSQVTLTTLPGNSPGDGSGHGTFVAGLAAGSRSVYAGAAPTAPIVSIDVADDKGMSMTSDVIAAVDWILANKAAKNIRRRQLLPPLLGPELVRLRPAREGRRAALALRRRRRGRRRQLRLERSRERRPLRARERPVRDHGRRRRHRQHH